MDEEVYKSLISFCEKIEKVASKRLLDMDVYDIYTDRYFDYKLSYGIILQLHTIETIKSKIEGLRNFRMLTNLDKKEGEAE